MQEPAVIGGGRSVPGSGSRGLSAHIPYSFERPAEARRSFSRMDREHGTSIAAKRSAIEGTSLDVEAFRLPCVSDS